MGQDIKLMDIMSNYQGYKQCELILVFDAYKVKGNIGEVSKYNNINVVYTKEAQTADNYIEKVTHDLSQKYRVYVATSDALEQIIVSSRGAMRISARESNYWLKKHIFMKLKNFKEKNKTNEKLFIRGFKKELAVK